MGGAMKLTEIFHNNDFSELIKFKKSPKRHLKIKQDKPRIIKNNKETLWLDNPAVSGCSTCSY